MEKQINKYLSRNFGKLDQCIDNISRLINIVCMHSTLFWT